MIVKKKRPVRVSRKLPADATERVVYATTIGLSILVVAAILRVGGLMLPEAPATLAGGAMTAASPLAQMIENASHPLARLLVQPLVIVGAARVCARLA